MQGIVLSVSTGGFMSVFMVVVVVGCLAACSFCAVVFDLCFVPCNLQRYCDSTAWINSVIYLTATSGAHFGLPPSATLAKWEVLTFRLFGNGPSMVPVSMRSRTRIRLTAWAFPCRFPHTPEIIANTALQNICVRLGSLFISTIWIIELREILQWIFIIVHCSRYLLELWTFNSSN